MKQQMKVTYRPCFMLEHNVLPGQPCEAIRRALSFPKPYFWKWAVDNAIREASGRKSPVPAMGEPLIYSNRPAGREE